MRLRFVIMSRSRQRLSALRAGLREVHQDAVHRVGRAPLYLFQNVRVDVARGRCPGVPEHGLDELDVRAFGEQERCGRMPQVMQANALLLALPHTGQLAERVPGSVDVPRLGLFVLSCG